MSCSSRFSGRWRKRLRSFVINKIKKHIYHWWNIDYWAVCVRFPSRWTSGGVWQTWEFLWISEFPSTSCLLLNSTCRNTTSNTPPWLKICRYNNSLRSISTSRYNMSGFQLLIRTWGQRLTWWTLRYCWTRSRRRWSLLLVLLSPETPTALPTPVTTPWMRWVHVSTPTEKVSRTGWISRPNPSVNFRNWSSAEFTKEAHDELVHSQRFGWAGRRFHGLCCWVRVGMFLLADAPVRRLVCNKLKCGFPLDQQFPGHAGGWESQLGQQNCDWPQLPGSLPERA